MSEDITTTETIEESNTIACENCRTDTDKDETVTHDNTVYCEDCYNEAFITCYKCDAATSSDDIKSAPNDDMLCESCFDNEYSNCEACGGVVSNDDSYSANGDYYCSDCYSERFFYCEGCNTECSQDDYAEDGQCNDCSTPKLEFKDSKTFDVNKSKRFVGIELEYIERDSVDFEAYGHRKDDASVSATDGDGSGYEFVSQPTNGDKLLNTIEALGKVFKSANAYVNSSCGFHVHLDMRDSTITERSNVFKFWQLYQDVLSDMCSGSRKSSTYCKPVPSSVSYYNAEASLDRYHSLNVQAYSKYSTFEVRVHQGTLDSVKIKNWCMLLLNFFDTFTKIDCTDSVYEEIKAMSKRKKLIYLFQSIKISLGLKKYIVKRIKKFGHVSNEMYFYKEPVQKSLDLGVTNTPKPNWTDFPVEYLLVMDIPF